MPRWPAATRSAIWPPCWMGTPIPSGPRPTARRPRRSPWNFPRRFGQLPDASGAHRLGPAGGSIRGGGVHGWPGHPAASSTVIGYKRLFVCRMRQSPGSASALHSSASGRRSRAWDSTSPRRSSRLRRSPATPMAWSHQASPRRPAPGTRSMAQNRRHFAALHRSDLDAQQGGLIIAQAFPLTPGNDIAAVAAPTMRVEFGLAKAKWKIIDCDSQQEGGDPPRRSTTIPRRCGTPLDRGAAGKLIRCRTISLWTWVKRCRSRIHLHAAPGHWDNGIIMRPGLRSATTERAGDRGRQS